MRPLLLLGLGALTGGWLPFGAGCSVGPESPPSERVASSPSPIVGGTLDGRRDYVVAVGDDAGFFCSGVLVSHRTVLTAAHCAGVTRVFVGADPANASMIEVLEEVKHPAFDPASLANDLAVLELAEAPPVAPALLLRETMANSAAFVGPSYAFAGFGDDLQADAHLRQVVTLPIAAVGPADVGKDTGTGPIDASMFYYRVAGKDPCSGDSGGPAFVVRGAVERVAGTTSFGDPACAVDGVDARADAPAVAAFIQPSIEAFEGDDPCRADGVCNEACNAAGELGDPDCAESHCAADGLCALACVAPVDPDCAGGGRCGPDGACDPSCAPADPDCTPSSEGSPASASSGAPSVSGSVEGGACALGPSGSLPRGYAALVLAVLVGARRCRSLLRKGSSG